MAVILWGGVVPVGCSVSKVAIDVAALGWLNERTEVSAESDAVDDATDEGAAEDEDAEDGVAEGGAAKEGVSDD